MWQTIGWAETKTKICQTQNNNLYYKTSDARNVDLSPSMEAQTAKWSSILIQRHPHLLQIGWKQTPILN